MGFTGTSKQVSATIRKIDGKALRNTIQTACLHVIGHAMEFGHSPLANALADQMALIAMTRKLQPLVIAFCVKNGPFNYSKDTGFVFSKAKKAEMIEAGYDFDEFVLSAPQWDDQPKAEKNDTTMDLVKELEKLAARAEKKSVDGKVVDAELIPFIKALVGQYVGKKIVAQAQAAAAAKAEQEKAVAQEQADEARTVDADLAQIGTATV